MPKFIEVRDTHGDLISINVDYIFAVETNKEKPETTIKIAVQGFNNFSYQYVNTDIPYDEILAAINS